jgi:hypothetical protein
MTESAFKDKFQDRMAAYERDYRIDELNQSNDRAQLHMLINAELTLEAFQEKIEDIIASENLVEKASDLKKLSDLMRDTTETVRKIQQTLAIDRKTRKSEETDNFAAWLRGIKREAKQFMDDRLLKVYCKNCKVMVGRWSAVHEHTAFEVRVQCSQCKKWAIAKRDERDIWFDLKADSEWRRKYPVEIVNAQDKEGFSADTLTEHLGDDNEFVIEGDMIIDGTS